jgi:Fe-S cluster assembly ATP-binding protein
VRNLEVEVGGKTILKGLNLTIEAGSVHAIMGPNGSGKSTLANVLAGKPGYNITAGEIFFDGQLLNDTEPEIRAQQGLFLAFQYPVEIPGVSNMEFLKAALDHISSARGEAQQNAVEFMKRVRAIATELDLNPEFLKRGVNEGFSGGEKKRNEILQLLLMHSPTNAVLMITHYQRLLSHIVPDEVHVLADGVIVKSGGHELALELEERGYAWLTQ